MGVRDRLTTSLSSLRKVFGNGQAADMAAAEAAAQMTPASPFSPGEPLRPYDGYSRTPRSRDFVTGYNIAARPRSHERISFETLRALIDAYDVAQMCIWHRIDSIRSLDWSLVATAGHHGDVADAIDIGMAALKKPDRQTPFATWLATYLYDVLAYDAGSLYRLRNRRGDAIGLLNVDGTTIAPLLDYWGRSPEAPAPAYVQFAQGLPWNQLTRSDLIYEPFRRRTNSPYGLAPLETILLNANTDLRFQAHFLQRFTEGNIPEAFASAPESWTPDQIEQWQTLWDSFMRGDQAAKHQIKWMPGGSGITWSNEQDFSDTFSLFLMRKTAAAYHVVPADLGFTENVNKSSGDSQADVQHRVGDLPLIRHTQDMLSSFLQDDLGLPLDFLFDLGEEQADRLQQAQADQIYVQLGAISSSDIREMRYGLAEPEGKPVPRFIFTERSGPIPLSALDGVAGPIDPATAAPAPDAPVPHQVFTAVEGTLPNPPIVAEPLAEQLYGPSALPAGAEEVGVERPVTKDTAASSGPTAGITADTGITSYDLVRPHHQDDDEDDDRDAELAKGELTAFRSFRKARRRTGVWRDFEFRHVDSRTARRLNQAGRAQVRKDTGEIAVAGLAVQAADTGRVLMLQRALDDEDPAAGTWEFPGGHLEGDETPLLGAWREWAEETGCIPPPGQQTGDWSTGIYAGIVWTVPSEASVPLTGRDQVSNPDDPDGDQIEAIAWWDPNQLSGNPAVRPELLESLDVVLEALGAAPQGGDEAVCPCGTPAVYDEIDGWQHADGSIGHEDGESVSDKMGNVTKAGDGSPKGDGPAWPGWEHDERTAAYWAPLIAAAASSALTTRQAEQLARDYQATGQTEDETATKTALVDAAVAWLAGQGLTLAAPMVKPLTGLYTDAYLIGTAAATAVVDGTGMQLGGWQPGDTTKANAALTTLGGTAGLMLVLGGATQAAQRIADARTRDIARALVEGITAGASISAIAKTIRAVVADPARAQAAVITEITRVSGIAAQLAYQRREVPRGRWLTEQDGHVCPVCDGNAAAGPTPIGDPYPSGDTTAPAHPRCRCAVLPA